MKIWKLWEDVNNYDSLMAKDSNFEHEFEALNGCSLIEGWEPIELKRMYGEGLPLSDYPYFFGRPVMSDKAISALDSIIRDSVEYLSLAFEEKNYTMVNITKILNVIDYEKAEYETFPNSKKILAFEKYKFRTCDELLTSDIFKLIDEPRRNPFVSDRFKKYVEENKLTGFKFELVWDSEAEIE